MRLAIAAVALAVAGCARSSPLPADPAAKLDPIAYFTGRSGGVGIVRKSFGGSTPVQVSSVGRSDGHGGLILDQNIWEGTKPSRQRRWLMQPAGPNRFTGTLTDAAGPVEVITAGPRATVRYRMKNGLEVTQRLALQRDGRTLLNRLTVKKFGVRVARLDETIRKVD